MKPKSTLRSFLCIASSAVLTISYAQATNLYWDSNSTTADAGATPTGTWGVDNFWNTDSTGGAGGAFQTATLGTDDLFFSAGTDAVNAYTISLNSATQNARLVTFEDGTATLNTGTLSLGTGGGITVSSTAVTGATISSDLTLSGRQTFNVAVGQILTLDTGTFTRNAGATLNVASTGTVTTTMTNLAVGSLVNDIIGPWASHGTGASTRYATIDGSNNIVAYTGGTAAATAAGVTSTLGTVNYDVAGGNATLGASANINTLRYTAAGGTLTTSTAFTTSGIMNVGGGTLTISGAVTGGSSGLVLNAANGNITVSSAYNNGGNLLVVDGAGQTTINGGLSGAGGLTKSGSGTLIINATATITNSSTGPIRVLGGVLKLGVDWNNHNNAISGGYLGSGSGSNIELNGGILGLYYDDLDRTLGTGNGQIQITGGRSGFAMYTNPRTTITFYNNAATEVVWGASGEGAATGYFNPSTFVMNDSAAGGGENLIINNKIDLNGANRTIETANASYFGQLSGVIRNSTGTAGITKIGNGMLILSASNTYNGGSTISAGTLRFDTRLSMPATGTVTVADGAALGVTVAGSGTTWGSGTGVAGIAGLTSTANSGEGYGGQAGPLVNFDGNSFLDLNVTGNVTESNAIGNGTATSIRLIKSGGSTLTLTSSSNSYSGGTTLTAGALALGHDSALSSGTIRLNGGTIQSNDATARSFTNAVTIGGNFTVGGTGNLTFSNTGASALGATRTITVTTSTVNATFAQAFSGSGAGITKAGAGTLTLTGNNTYTGATTISGGTVVLNNDGDVTGSAVSITANNTSLTVTGGSGVTSTWNTNGGNFGTTNTALSNVQVLIDGAGYAGSARVTGVGILEWGRAGTSGTLALTNGGQMNVNGEVRTGSTYYASTGGANITIGGGTATSTFTGNTGQAFYIGYGEREGTNNNVVTVSSGGVLTSVGNMFVGHVNNQQGNDLASTANKLTVTGTGTASMVSVTVGYAQNAGAPPTHPVEKANANVVEVISGGTLTTSGVNYIGRANAASSESNANTLTVTGTGSSWAAGSQNVLVGFTNNASAVSNNNILTVGTDGTVTGVAALTVGSGAGTETGNELVMLGGGSLTATTISVSASNTLRFGTGGTTSALSLTGDITNNGSMIFNLSDTITQGTNFDSAFGGSGTVTQNGSGTLVLNGANTYTGGSTITAGTLQFAKTNAMPSTGSVAVQTGATLAVNAGGTNEFTDATTNTAGSIGGLLAGTGGQGAAVTYTGNVKLGIDTTNASGGSLTYSGVIGNVGTTLGLTKLGTGTLVLDQTNTYTGATTINAGTLLINGDNSTATGAVTAASGATLGGTGEVGGNTTILSGGYHAPGSPGNDQANQDFAGNLTYSSGSIFSWEIDTVSTNYDSVTSTASGALSGAGAIFNITSSTAYTDGFWNANQSWTDIFSGFATSEDWDVMFTSISGTGLTWDGLQANAGAEGYFTISTGSLNWTAAVVPEPTSALAGLLLGAGLLRRRRTA